MAEPDLSEQRSPSCRYSSETARVARIKMQPHSIEAEQSVLGGLLLSAEGWDVGGGSGG